MILKKGNSKMNLKKNLKKLCALILSITTFISALAPVSAETALQTFQGTYYYNGNVPIASSAQGSYNVLKTSDGRYVYCTEYTDYPPVPGVTYTKSSLITDNGMNYILGKAYNAKNDNENFIYKTALWFYMMDKGMSQGSLQYQLQDLRNKVNASNSAAANEIKKLVADAKKAGANDTAAPTIKLDAGAGTFKLEGDYYISNTMTVTSSTGAFNVGYTAAPADSKIVRDGNKFYLKIPAKNVKDLETPIGIVVNNSKDVYTSYNYTPNNAAYQNLAMPFKETKYADAKAVVLIKKTFSVPVLKIDATTGEALSGAELELKDSNGKVIKTWTTTGKAEVITGLSAGTYTITEKKAPAGYKALKTSVKFTVDKNGNVDGEKNKNAEIIVKNEKSEGGVSISKQDITNKKELPGATLVVKDYDGNVIEEWVSTNEPHIIKGLKPGIYTLTETIAPEGYILSTETITFTVKDDGSITKVVMYNTPNSKDIPVENTASFKTITSSLLGTLIIIAGGYIIFKNSKKKELSK